MPFSASWQGLFGGAVLHLGTEKHHERYLRDITSVELPGCFAMTETGHGSNVQELGTTATYDPEAQEWVVHTPEPPKSAPRLTTDRERPSRCTTCPRRSSKASSSPT